MSTQPFISVICSCFNHQDYIINTLNSIIHQTYQNLELVVVDDASHDKSSVLIQQWIEKYPEVIFIQNPTNLGLNKSFNQAILKTKGDYFMDFSGDDLLEPNAVEMLVKQICNQPTAAFVFSNGTHIQPNQQTIKPIFDKETSQRILQYCDQGTYYENLLKKSDIINSGCALYNKAIFTKLGTYDEQLNFEDLDYWLRTSRNYPIAYIDKKLVKKIFLENSLGNGFFKKSKHTKKLHLSMYLILQKTFHINKTQKEYDALITRLFKEMRWAIRTFNFRYMALHINLLLKTYFKKLTLK